MLSRIPTRRISTAAAEALESAALKGSEAIKQKAAANVAALEAYRTRQQALGEVASSVAKGQAILKQHGIVAEAETAAPTRQTIVAEPIVTKSVLDPSMAYLGLGLLTSAGILGYKYMTDEEQKRAEDEARAAEDEHRVLIDEYKMGSAHEDLYIQIYDLINKNTKSYTLETDIYDPELKKLSEIFRAVISQIKLRDISNSKKMKTTIYPELGTRPIKNIGNLLSLLEDYLIIIDKKGNKSPGQRSLGSLVNKIAPTYFTSASKILSPYRPELKGGSRKSRKTKNRRRNKRKTRK